ncbi:peptide ABC transporter permease [Candidatus Epulonipiscium fishelsonii]|uniref:Peptide ABC transporter permease n=1 Tax=Candidatus Epulonipiscium fishelsonii TaxID=77094 RepID=A0ACC8X9G9_9FIRM|nr:peptide ABC transporter permease [Epulopiscium sp. SCG-B11WGA-EpuloA1]
MANCKVFFSVIWSNKMSRVGLIILTFFIMLAIFGPIVVEAPKASYGERLELPSMEHWLGTDYAGRDILAQFIVGSRSVLLVAVYTAIFSIIFACSIGILAGFIGGRVDDILSIFMNIVITMPSFPVMMVLSMIIRVDNSLVFGLILSLWSWAGLAKAIRSQILIIKHKDFIEASVVMGISTFNIITKDIIPNIISFIAVNFISIMKGAIISSVGLMVLGLVPFQGNHWGMMLQMAMSQSGLIVGGIGGIIYFMTPLCGLLFFQLGCYLFASGIDEALNPRLR